MHFQYDSITIFAIIKKMQMDQKAYTKMNEKLFLKKPDDFVLGRKIIENGLLLINKLGYEQFTFKKLASEIHTTEAGIYRYFENKHRLLIYLIALYWNIIDEKVQVISQTEQEPEKILEDILHVLVLSSNSDLDSWNMEEELHKLIIWEGAKTYHTRNVNDDNQNQLFKPYKDLCARISNIIIALNPHYPFPHSLVSSIIEISHAQKYFREHLPSLTDFNETKKNEQLISFLKTVLFGSIREYSTR
jgi:AcrR family transcriptional regulator